MVHSGIFLLLYFAIKVVRQLNYIQVGEPMNQSLQVLMLCNLNCTNYSYQSASMLNFLVNGATQILVLVLHGE